MFRINLSDLQTRRAKVCTEGFSGIFVFMRQKQKLRRRHGSSIMPVENTCRLIKPCCSPQQSRDTDRCIPGWPEFASGQNIPIGIRITDLTSPTSKPRFLHFWIDTSHSSQRLSSKASQLSELPWIGVTLITGKESRQKIPSRIAAGTKIVNRCQHAGRFFKNIIPQRQQQQSRLFLDFRVQSPAASSSNFWQKAIASL